MTKTRLIIAGSEQCADLYWATGFYVPDPIVFIEHHGKKILVASDLEVSRAKKEARVDTVLSHTTYENKLRKSGQKRKAGDVTASILKELGVQELEVPSYFPLRQAEILKSHGFKLNSAADPFYPQRQIKTQKEKKHVISALRATEAGIQAGIDLLKRCRIRKGKIYNGATVLTSEHLRQVIEMKMMENGALGQHTIVACGKQAADPHCRGSGILFANQTIVMDVFPKHIDSGYHGDITRTVVKGKASETLKKMYAAVRESQAEGMRRIHDGVDAAYVHQGVCEVLDKSGFRTGIIDGKPQGFIHSTGHGLGLDIHEAPRVSRISEKLRTGHIVTVEPGLYYEKLGGIRIEDVVYVTKKGCEVLTKIPKVFEIA